MGTNCIGPALRHILGDDDLCGAIDYDLGIVSLHEAVLALHDPAFRIGEVLLRFGLRRGRGRGGWRSGFLAPFALRAADSAAPIAGFITSPGRRQGFA